MKKIISFLLCTAVLLTTCGCSKNTPDYNDNWRIISYYDMFEHEKNGMFITTDNQRLDFLDFSSGTIVPLCDDPTCKHISSSSCSAYGKTNHPFIVKQKLCWFTITDIYQTSDGYQTDLQLWQSDLNGENQHQLFQAKGGVCDNSDRFVLYGDKLFYFERNQLYDAEFHEKEPSISLKSYNFSDGSQYDYGKVVSGYGCGVWCYGIWEDKIYFTTSAAEDNRPFMERLEDYIEENNLDDNEALSSFAKADIYKMDNWLLDIQNNSITFIQDCPYFISKSYKYTLKDGALSYTDHNNKTKAIENKNVISGQGFSSCCMLYAEDGTYIWDETSNTLYLCPSNGEQSVCYVYEDTVVLRENSENNSELYSIVSLKEWAVKQ